MCVLVNLLYFNVLVDVLDFEIGAAGINRSAVWSLFWYLQCASGATVQDAGTVQSCCPLVI